MAAELSPHADEGGSGTATAELGANQSDAMVIPAMRGRSPADTGGLCPVRQAKGAKTLLVLPDLRMPSEDRKALTAVIRFIGEFQPDDVIQVGELVNFSVPSPREARLASVRADYVKRQLLEPLRHVYDGPVHILAGKSASAGESALERLLDFDGFGVGGLAAVHEFAPRWVMARGPLRGISVSPIAGNTALNAAKKLGMSVLLGHTNRLGLGSHTVRRNGKAVRTLTGVEIGNLVNVGNARTPVGHSHHGFTLVRIDGTRVQPKIVRILARQFAVDGVVYRLTR